MRSNKKSQDEKKEPTLPKQDVTKCKASEDEYKGSKAKCCVGDKKQKDRLPAIKKELHVSLDSSEVERFLGGDDSFLINNNTNSEGKETASITLCSGTIKVEPKFPVSDKVQKVIKKPTNMGKKPNKEATKCAAAVRRNKSPPVKRTKDNGSKVNENTTKKDAKCTKAGKLQKEHIKQEPKSPAVSEKDFKGQTCQKQITK